MSGIDFIITKYRWKLTNIAQLWHSLLPHGYGDVRAIQTCHEVTETIDSSISLLLANRLRVAQGKQNILDIQQALAVSRLAVDAKIKHLDQDEEEKVEERQHKFAEIQISRNIVLEKARLEQNAATARNKLNVITEVIDEKCERLHHLENFHEWLVTFSASDIQCLKEQTEKARVERSIWDKTDLDVSREITMNMIKLDDIEDLQRTVKKLTDTLNNYRSWYEEELQTKLFYCSHSIEMKRKMEQLTSTALPQPKGGQGGGDEMLEDAERQVCLENILIDGFTPLPPNEMRTFLLDQFGTQSISDCKNLPRFKDIFTNISVAYLMDECRRQQNDGPGVMCDTEGGINEINRKISDQIRSNSWSLDNTCMTREVKGVQERPDQRSLHSSPWTSSAGHVDGPTSNKIAYGSNLSTSLTDSISRKGSSSSRFRKLFKF